jgi:hypothetical protein
VDNTFVKTATSYRIDITVPEMVAIMDAESYTKHTTPITPTLDERLADLDGVTSIEYNGHFGPAIFFDLDADYDTADGRSRILSTIRQFIAQAKLFNIQPDGYKVSH